MISSVTRCRDGNTINWVMSQEIIYNVIEINVLYLLIDYYYFNFFKQSMLGRSDEKFSRHTRADNNSVSFYCEINLLPVRLTIPSGHNTIIASSTTVQH